MSIYSDYYEDDCITSEAVFLRQIEERADKGIWVNKNGTEIKITDMSDQYIRNCMNYIKYNDDLYFTYITVFRNELKKRGVI